MSRSHSLSSAQPELQTRISSSSSNSGQHSSSLASISRSIAQDPCLGHLVENALDITSDDQFDTMGGGREKLIKTKRTVFDENYYKFDLFNNYDSYISVQSKHSRTAFCPPYPGGTLRFMLEGYLDIKDRHYVCLEKDANMDTVAMYMANAWHRRTPKLVLTVISTSRYFKPWVNDRFTEEFQTGLIHAANLTEMWILTDGLDLGISKVIGDAVYIEMIRRKNLEMNPLHIKNFNCAERLPRLTILGIVSKSNIVYADLLNGRHIQTANIFNFGGKPHLGLYELNPDHTHFILFEDSQIDADCLNNFRYALEMRFTKPVGKARRYSPHIPNLTQPTTCSSEAVTSQEQEVMLTPFIGLLVQGGPVDIDHALSLLKRRIPVVVIGGSGLAADLVAFAYQEVQERTDADYLDGYIKPELMRRVVESFPDDFANNDIARNQCRDKIIECVKFAVQDDLTFLTVIDTNKHEVRLTDLSKYLLMALFRSQARRIGRQMREQMQWDLQLTLDWNRPDIAKSEIFQRYNLIKFRIEDHLFHQALLRPNREEFINLFFEHGMLAQIYLNHKRLHNLFENAHDRDFFVGICLQGVLGKTLGPKFTINSNFVEGINCELNRLLYKLTRLQKLVDPYELSMNSLGSSVTDCVVAERRAINTLVFWAALTNRFELAKILWKRTDNPMAMALILSMLLHNLAKWCKDLDIRKKVKNTAIDFGKMSVNLLRLSYSESSTFAFAALSKRMEDFNNRTVVELAKLGGNKFFIAHPCCQKWLAQRWLGNLHIHMLDWGPFKMPDWLKIYLSVFFVLPMFLWISFIPMDNDRRSITEEDEDDVMDEAAEHAMILRSMSFEDKMLNAIHMQPNAVHPVNLDSVADKRHSYNPNKIPFFEEGKAKRKSAASHRSIAPENRRKQSHVKVTFNSILNQGEGTIKLPIYKQIYYLWSATITKFWMNQLFYVLYLAVFSIALLLPYCGYFNLNVTVLIWTFSVWAELVRRTWSKRKLYPELPLKWTYLEALLIFIFIIVFVVVRILPHYFEYSSYSMGRSFMSLGLLYFYYRMLAIFVPVSPTLGPMLVSIITMVKKDFFDWMRLFLLVLVSGAITIQAVIYPSFPLGYRSLRQAFSRAIFGLFLTKIDDLDGSPACTYLYDSPEAQYCSVSSYYNVTQKSLLETCPYASLTNYVFVIQYLVFVKLIFTTLLYAMFAVTTQKVTNESIEIWKYQRYGMIIDFEERLIVPPPLTLLVYFYFFLKWFAEFVCRVIVGCCIYSTCCKDSSDQKEQPRMSQIIKFHRASDYNYWKNCVSLFIEEEESCKEEQNRAKTQSDCIYQLLEEVRQHRQLSRQLNDRIVQLENNFTNSCLLLEEMKHMIEGMNPKTQILTQEPKKLLHVAARRSPYPDTSIRRFPVFDKFVPWEVPFDVYDPDVYTLPVSEFSPDLQVFIDPDILQIKQQMEERQQLTIEEQNNLIPLPTFEPLYNSVTTTILDNINVEIDRTSWITVDSQPLRYKLDSTDVPQNPLGRTGIRGRGILWRWGPNHRIAAVVTRWRRKYSPLGFAMDHILVDGKRVLEFIVVVRKDTGEFTLPGGDVYGKTTAYSVMCEEFLKSVFMEEEVEGSLKLDQDDMIKFFGQFASKKTQDATATGFSASILYRGYIDDPTNTDNAWRECEVWNFHYEKYNVFDDKIKEREKTWREVSPHMRLYGNQDSIVLEAARIHGAYV